MFLLVFREGVPGICFFFNKNGFLICPFVDVRWVVLHGLILGVSFLQGFLKIMSFVT